MISGFRAFQFLAPGNRVEFDRSRCSRHRYAAAGCSTCLEICPHGALSWTAAGLTRCENLCRGCLLCCASCPTGAHRATELALGEMLTNLSMQRKPLLACTRHSRTLGHARVPCLGLFADPNLLLAFLLGVGKPLSFNLTACGDCDNRDACSALSSTCERVSALGLEALPEIILLHSEDDLDFQEPGLTRRELFSVFGRKTRRQASIMLSRLDEERAESFRGKMLPRGRALLLEVLAAQSDRSTTTAVCKSFPTCSMTEACRGCIGCVGICPTGALVAPEHCGSSPGFVSYLCTECGICQAFCRQGAISVNSQEEI